VMRRALNLGLVLLVLAVASPLRAAVYDWGNACTAPPVYGRIDVRDPSIVYNHWDEAGNYPPFLCSGYDDTVYAFAPCNFPPVVNQSAADCTAANKPPSCPSSGGTNGYTHIDLLQFGVPPVAKEIFVDGFASVSDWQGTIYVWFRAPGATTWDLTPITDSGHEDSIGAIPVPVAPLPASEVNPAIEMVINGQVVHEQAGDPAIDLAWGVNNPSSPTTEFALNLILAGYCQ
jgi:hypothetical protein